jgi:hypothetical protein
MNKRVYLSQDLIDAIMDTTKRTDAGLPVTDAEREWIRSELAMTPGYTEWHARDLLEQALAKAIA